MKHVEVTPISMNAISKMQTSWERLPRKNEFRPLDDFERGVLREIRQLGNQLYAEGQHAEAARIYESGLSLLDLSKMGR